MDKPQYFTLKKSIISADMLNVDFSNTLNHCQSLENGDNMVLRSLDHNHKKLSLSKFGCLVCFVEVKDELCLQKSVYTLW